MNIYKHAVEINKIKKRHRTTTPVKVPRKFARYDWQLNNKNIPITIPDLIFE